MAAASFENSTVSIIYYLLRNNLDSSSLVTSHASENVMNVEERVRRVKKESENNFQIDIIYNRLDDLVHLVLELLQFNELIPTQTGSPPITCVSFQKTSKTVCKT
jgi:hypothetical protein